MPGLHSFALPFIRPWPKRIPGDRAGAFSVAVSGCLWGGLAHAFIDMAGKLGEIVDAKLDQLLRGGVIGGLVRPGLARVEDLRVDACKRDRHLEAELRIRSTFGSVQQSGTRPVEECATHITRHT